MWRTSVFFCLLVISVEPEEIGSQPQFEEKWIKQPLDHFNVRDNRTWLMRFYENDQFFNKSGPMFIMLGGEWAISPSYLQAGTLFENAKVHGAMMYYTEHRYYGDSHPVPDMSSENLRYLSVDQALTDVAFFIETKKQELNIPNSPVIVFGSSYAGNMAAWMRIKYPHLVQGALASSAAVRVKVDVFEYYEAITNSLKNFDDKCVSTTREAISAVESLLIGDNANPEKIKDDFNLGAGSDTVQSNNPEFVISGLANMFAEAVQMNKVEDNKKTSIENLCNSLTSDSSNKTVYERLATVFRQYKMYYEGSNYEEFVDIYRNTSWASSTNKFPMRLWTYQTCTEFGIFQTSNSNESVFGSLIPPEYSVRMCEDMFGEYYNMDILQKGVRRTNMIYGANTPDVRNVIFTNGDFDPWRVLSVLSDLNEHSPAILIKGVSHSQDLWPELPTDSDDLKEARRKIAKTIAKWLKG